MNQATINWNCSIVNFDNKEFLVHAQISVVKMVFYSWVSILGDKQLADKYICEIKLTEPYFSSNVRPHFN